MDVVCFQVVHKTPISGLTIVNLGCLQIAFFVGFSESLYYIIYDNLFIYDNIFDLLMQINFLSECTSHLGEYAANRGLRGLCGF